MHLSSRARKTLLTLLMNHDSEGSSRRGGLTIKAIARQLEGEGVFYAEGKHLESGRAASYGRLLRRFMAEGYVDRRKKPTGHGHVCSLTNMGARARGEGEARQERLREAMVPVMLGSSLVLTISFLERLVEDIINRTPDSGAAQDPMIPNVRQLRKWQSHLDLDLNWYGWNELGNFIRLRHCYAHEFGRMLDRQRPHVEDFLTQLQNGLIGDRLRLREDEEGEIVPDYYEIVDGEVILQRRALHYLRRLCVGFIELLIASEYPII